MARAPRSRTAGARRRSSAPAGSHVRGETPRARILAAAEEILATHGAEQLTATAITAAAEVSRTTFYAIFADREDCLLALFEEVVDRLRAVMLLAYSAEDSWLDGVRASLSVLLEVLDSQPHLARFLIVGGVSGDTPLVVRRRAVLADLARALEADAPERSSEAAPVPFGADALVGGAASIIHSRLSEEPVPALAGLSASLMAVLVLPFVGRGSREASWRAHRPGNRSDRRPEPRIAHPSSPPLT